MTIESRVEELAALTVRLQHPAPPIPRPALFRAIRMLGGIEALAVIRAVYGGTRPQAKLILTLIEIDDI